MEERHDLETTKTEDAREEEGGEGFNKTSGMRKGVEEKELRGGTKHTRSAVMKATTRTGASDGEPENIGAIKWKMNKKEKPGGDEKEKKGRKG